MEQIKNENVIKVKSKKSAYSTIRLTQNTKKKLTQLLNKSNKKNFGKRVKADQLILLALELITDDHVKNLQENSLSNADKLEMKFKEYVRKNGSISKDDFLGKLLEDSVQRAVWKMNKLICTNGEFCYD